MASAQKIVRDTRADIVVLDAHEEPVLLVMVKATRSIDPEVYRETVGLLDERARTFSIPYFMLADLETVRIFRQGSLAPDLEIPSVAALTAYEADFAKKRETRIFHPYLERLVESWLRDLAYAWKSDSPPYRAELERLGLVQRITRGSTVSESPFAA
jgi:hypothetical protein